MNRTSSLGKLCSSTFLVACVMSSLFGLGTGAPDLQAGDVGAAPLVSTTPGVLFAQRSRSRQPKTEPWVYIVYVAGGTLAVGGLIYLVLHLRHKPKTLELEGSAATDGMLGGYRLLNLMMTGQTSQVWEATEVSSGRHFAIKMLLPECAGVKEHREFLFHEAEVGMQLAHENIIRIVEVVKDPKYPHFIMDFFPGGNLKLRILHKEMDYLKENAHDIFKQTATALAFINAKGWVHRDVKPDNILVNAAGEVRVIDFAITVPIKTGMAKMLGKKGNIQGTRSYMSPEQIRNEPLDGRADIYSFGATAYEIAAGRPPFRAGNSQDLLSKHINEAPMSPCVHNPEVTEEFGELVLKMLAKKKENRPGNFHEILMALKKVRVFKGETVKSTKPAPS